jgi:hypothetical protein
LPPLEPDGLDTGFGIGFCVGFFIMGSNLESVVSWRKRKTASADVHLFHQLWIEFENASGCHLRLGRE